MNEKTIEQSFWQKTKRFFVPVNGNIKTTILLLVYFTLELSVGILFIFFIRDITLSFESNNTLLFKNTLNFYFFAFVVVFTLTFISKNFWTYSYNRYRKTIEQIYMPQFIKMDGSTLESVGTGKTVAIISKGIKMWGQLIDHTLIEILRILTSLIVSIYFLVYIHAFLGFLLLVLLIIGQALGMYTNKLVSDIRQNRIELDNTWSRRLVKLIMAKNEVLQSQKIRTEIGVLDKLHEGQIYYNKKMATYLVPFFSIGNIIVLIILFVMFLYFGDLYFSGEASLASIAAITGAMLMMQKDFIGLLDFIKGFGRDFAEIENMWNFFDTTPQIEGYEEGNMFQHESGKIELKNLSYGYTPETPIFKDFSLKIPGNSVTALVGPSGGGKSTLVKLISGYIRQDAGDILVDDQNLRETSLKSYYKDIGYLTQEPSVFDGTVRENLEYGVQNVGVEPCVDPNNGSIDSEIHKTLGQTHGAAPTRELEKIISLAHCEFIYDLPNGLDTEIGERGVKLSGGQKQRLAIAKIFLKDPKIIILDEPTSALDSLSEKKITEAMHNLFTGRTVIVIAHRLQTVKHADDIIVIEGGKVIERGTHSELTKKKGFYKEMLDLQSGF